MEQLKEVKLVINGLLISSPLQLTLRDLNRDYAGQEGRRIPFQELGFPTLLDFIQSIPDTVELRDNYGDRSNPIVCSVRSERSQHVQSLVDRQRKPAVKRKPRNHYRPPRGPYRTYDAYVPPPRFQQRLGPQPLVGIPVHIPGMHQPLPDQRDQQRQSPIPCAEGASVGRVSTYSSTKSNNFIPIQFESKVMSIVKENPGISPQYLEDRLNKTMRMNVQTVYNGIDEVLKSMGNQLEVMDNKVYLSSFHGNAQSEYSIPTASSSGIPAKVKSYLPAGYIDDEGDAEDDEMYVGGFSGDETEDLPPLPGSSHNGAGDNVHIGNGEDLYSSEYICESLMSDAMKKNLTEMLKKHPKGIWCWDLPEVYEAEYGTPLDCRDIGYVSVIQMMQSVPELFSCVLVDGSDCKILSSTSPFSEGSGIEGMSISRSMMEKIKVLVRVNPCKGIKGIYEDEFCAKFEDYYHTKFNFREMGFASLHSLFEALDGETIECVRISNRYRICPIKDKENGDVGRIFPPLKKEDASCIRCFPKDVVGPLESLQPVVFPQNAKIDSFVEIIVAEISSPNNFWAQLRGPTYHTALGRMMDQMEAFYGNSSNDVRYTMPAEAMAVGVTCVTGYMEVPHRCRIIKVDPVVSSLKVLFVDFGTISPAERSSLRFLHRDFIALPTQAFRCRLHSIRPIGGQVKYPREVGQRFLQLVTDKGLMAEIKAIDHQAHTMSVILVDTSGEDDVFINDVLVEEGLAEYDINTNPAAVEESATQTDNLENCTSELYLNEEELEPEVEKVPEIKAEPEERVQTRRPADILLNSRRKISAPPGFGPQIPSNSPQAPSIQPQVSTVVCQSNMQQYSDQAYRNDWMYLTRYHPDMNPEMIHATLMNNMGTSDGYRQRFPLTPSLNTSTPATLSLIQHRETQLRLDRNQEARFQNHMHNNVIHNNTAHGSFPFRNSAPQTYPTPPFQSLNPNAAPYIPPPLMPMVSFPQNCVLPQNSLQQFTYNNQFHQAAPWQQPTQAIPWSQLPLQGSIFDSLIGSNYPIATNVPRGPVHVNTYPSPAETYHTSTSSVKSVPPLPSSPNESLGSSTVLVKSEPPSSSSPNESLGSSTVLVKSEPPLPSSPTESNGSSSVLVKSEPPSSSSPTQRLENHEDNIYPAEKLGGLEDNGYQEEVVNFDRKSETATSESSQHSTDVSESRSMPVRENPEINSESTSRNSAVEPTDAEYETSPLRASMSQSEDSEVEDNNEEEDLHSHADFNKYPVRFINIGGNILHLISVDGVLHLITDELMSLASLKKNVALKILKAKNVAVQFQELNSERHSAIFSELERRPSLELLSATKLQVVRFRDVPNMLRALRCEENIIQAVVTKLEHVPPGAI